MITFSIPSLPPSSNTAYFNKPGGGRMLTKEGRTYLVETKAYLAQNYPRELSNLRANEPYALQVDFYFETLTNKGWPKTAESRYKRLDASNRLKLLEDAFKDAAGIDDSQHMAVLIRKLVGSPHTNIYLWPAAEMPTPFYNAPWNSTR